MQLETRSDLYTVLGYGATCQIAQVVLLRELLMVFHGNEFSLGIVFAAWMIWVGIGSRVGAAVANRTSEVRRVLAVYAVALLVVLPSSVALIRVSRVFFDLPPGAYLSVLDMSITCLVVMAPVGLLLGGYFVLLARLRRHRLGAADTTGAADTYIGEAVGNALGGLVFTLLLVHSVASLPLLVLCGALLLIGLVIASDSATGAVPPSGAPGATGAPDDTVDTDGTVVVGASAVRRRGPLLALSLGVPALVALLAGGPLEEHTSRLQWSLQAPAYELLETRQSRYGSIAVLQRDDQVSFFQSGNLLFSTSLTDDRLVADGRHDRAVGLEEQEAVTLAHLSMTQHPAPRSVLLIGGGLRGTLREISRYPVERIDYVELDDILVDTALPYLGEGTRAALDDPRVRLIHADGRIFVKDSAGRADADRADVAGSDAVRTDGRRYDVIVVDVPDPATAVLNRFYTVEFFSEARERLTEDGVLVISATSTADLRGSAVANRNATIYHTLRRTFPDVLPVGERSLVYIAAVRQGQLTSDIFTLIQRYRDAGVASPAFSAAHFTVLFEPELLQRVNWILRHHGREADAHRTAPESAPLLLPSIAEMAAAEEELPAANERFFINSDFRPIGYYHTLIFWNVLARGDRGAILRRVAAIEPWWIFPPMAIVLLLTFTLRVFSAPPRKFAVLSAVFTTGMSTMALQVALLLAFQSIYGFVYEMVGLIVALFMAGLATGTTVVQRLVRDKARLGMLTAMQGAVALLALGVAVALPHAAALQSAAGVFALFAIITFAAGALNGADFPLAAACYLRLDLNVERATGTVYSVELFGACLGAALAGIAVAPVLGIIACCLLAALANGTACAQLLVCGRGE